MNLNKSMHPRNPYRDKTNFQKLAVDYPEFRKHAQQDLTGKIHIDFKNVPTLRALTRALCHKDFQINLTIPDNHLIPTLPLRLNYLLWIEDLLATDGTEPGVIRGIDIGTGATCIYPLLGCRRNGWNFIATESNVDSLTHAVTNVEQNDMKDSVKVVKADPDVMFPNFVKEEETTYAFCMCNPPFFSESLEETKPESAPRIPPTNPGCSSEKVFAGGETKFVEKIIEDSLELKEKIRIYTTMLGKGSSVKQLKVTLGCLKPPVTSVATTKFCQGKTVRYGIAWTYLPNLDLKKATATSVKSSRPLTVEIAPPVADLPNHYRITKDAVQRHLQDLQVSFRLVEDYKRRCRFAIVANETTWLHQRRKRRELKRQSLLKASTENGHEVKDVNCNKRALDRDEETETPQAKQAKCLGNGTNNGLVNVTSGDEVPATSNGSSASDVTKVALKCDLLLCKQERNVLLSMVFVDGHAGRDGMFQLSQYLKNRLK